MKWNQLCGCGCGYGYGYGYGCGCGCRCVSVDVNVCVLISLLLSFYVLYRLLIFFSFFLSLPAVVNRKGRKWKDKKIFFIKECVLQVTETKIKKIRLFTFGMHGFKYIHNSIISKINLNFLV